VKILGYLTLGFLLLLGWLIMAIGLVLFTPAGTRIAIHIADQAAGETFHVQQTQGQLGNLDLMGIEVNLPAANLRIERLRWDFAWSELRIRHVHIRQLRIDGLTWQMLEVEAPQEQPDEPFVLPEPPVLPFTAHIEDFTLRDGRILTAGQTTPQEIKLLQFELKTTSDQITVSRLKLLTPELDLNADSRLDLSINYPVELDASVLLTLPGYAPIESSIYIHGNLDRLDLEQQIDAPYHAEIKASLLQPLAQLGWKMQLKLAQIKLADISPDLTDSVVESGLVNLSGTMQEAEGRIELVAYIQPLDIHLSVSSALQLNQQRIEIEDLDIQQSRTGRAHIEGNGKIFLPSEDQGVHWDARFNGRHINWPLSQADGWSVADVSVISSGGIDHYLVETSVRAAMPMSQDMAPLKPGAEVLFDGSGHGDAQSLNLENLSLRAGDGSIDGHVELSWSPELKWNAQLKSSRLDPSALVEGWPGALDFSLASEGQYDDDGLSVSVDLGDLQGRLRGYPISGDALLRVRDNRIIIEQLDINSAQSNLKGKGIIGDDLDVSFDLMSPDLSQIHPEAKGHFKLSLRAQGSKLQPMVDLEADVGNLGWSDQLHLETLSVGGIVDLSGDRQSDLQLRIHGVKVGENSIDEAALHVKGLPEAHDLHISMDSDMLDLGLKAQGQWRDQIWEGTLDVMELVREEEIAMILTAPAPLKISSASIQAEALCWALKKSPKTLKQGDLCAKGQWRKAGPWQAGLDLTKIDLQILAPWIESLDMDLSGRLDGSIQARQKPGASLILNAELRSAAGRLVKRDSLRGADENLSVEYTDFHLGVSADAERSQATLAAHLNEQNTVDVVVYLPAMPDSRSWNRWPVRGSLDIQVPDIAVVSPFVSALDRMSGKLDVAAGFSGSMDTPVFSGHVRLDKLQFDVVPAGITIENAAAVIEASNGRRINISASLQSGDGQIEAAGHVELKRAMPELELKIHGDRFEAYRTVNAEALISPDLSIRLKEQELSVQGVVNIPEASIHPRDMSSAIKANADEWIKVEEEITEPASAKLRQQIHVELGLGPQVNIEAYGLTGQLEGSLLLKAKGAQSMTASGEFRIKDGQYAAYGQNLTIESGRIIYAGSSLTQPALDLRAVRHVERIVAGIEVRGTLQKPDFSLFSDPSMPQAEQLSYLMLGRPLPKSSGQGNRNDSELLMQAAYFLGLQGTERIASRLGRPLGIEDISIESKTNIDESELVLGRHLSPQLYVSYGFGLFSNARTFAARYNLSEHWSLSSEFGAESSADIFYEFSE